MKLSSTSSVISATPRTTVPSDSPSQSAATLTQKIAKSSAQSDNSHAPDFSFHSEDSPAHACGSAFAGLSSLTDTDDDGVADVAVLDDDGDGDIDAVAIDNDHDGEFDELALDGDEHESLETTNDDNGQVQDVDYEDSDSDLGDEADYDFEL